MKQPQYTLHDLIWESFSTLNSGLRDETATSPTRRPVFSTTFSTLNSGLRDETCGSQMRCHTPVAFSTLNSGLRDETRSSYPITVQTPSFQYPQLGPTR